MDDFVAANTERQSMLNLTDNASSIVKDLTDQMSAQLGDTHPEAEVGLRITEEDSQGLMVSAAGGPEPGDQVLEQDGARVYLDEGAAQMLDDQTLDAAVDESGQVQFALASQPPS